MVLIRVALVFCVLLVEVVYSEKQGDKCVVEQSGAAGTCKIITDCPVASAAVNRGVLPQICFYIHDTTAIVCCPDAPDAPDAPVILKKPQGDYGKKSRQKCKEYAAYANTTYISPTLSGGPPKLVSYLDCSFQYLPHIVGGSKAKPKELPHSAAIGYDSLDGSRVYGCGGSLISEYFVVTAGHCHDILEMGSLKPTLAKSVRLGDLNLATTTDDAQPQEYDIAEFILHPKYRAPSHYNDILLLRLAQKVQFNHYVRPLCLFTQDEVPTDTKSGIASGWGVTKSGGNTSDHLLKVTLDFASQKECYESFEPNIRKLKNGIEKELQICAGSPTELKDTCQADSGGPLQIYNTDIKCMYYLVGITSFGKMCAVTMSPAVYTRVSHYVDWIEKIVWP